MSKNAGLKETGPKKNKKFLCSDNTRQNFGTKYRNPVKLDWTRKV